MIQFSQIRSGEFLREYEKMGSGEIRNKKLKQEIRINSDL